MIVLKRTLAWHEPAQDFDFFFFCWNVWRIDCSFSATYKPLLPYFLRSSAQIQADLGKMIFHIINFLNFVQLWFQNIQSNIKCQIDTDTMLLRKIFLSSLFLLHYLLIYRFKRHLTRVWGNMTYKYVHKHISFILLRTNAAVKCATWIFCSLRLKLSRCRKAHHVTSYLWISFGILVNDRDWVLPSINQTYFTSKIRWTTSFLPHWSLLRLYIKISQSNYV